MLHTALWNANTVMQDVLPTLLSKPGASQTVSLNINDEQAQSSDVVHAKLLDLVENEEIALVLYNSLTRARTEVSFYKHVTLHLTRCRYWLFT